MTNNPKRELTTFPEPALDLSKQKFPPAEEGRGNLSIFTATLAQVGDRIQPWGSHPMLRDRQLRSFWPTESYLAGAIYAVCISRAALEWEITVEGGGTGGTRLEQALTDMLNGSIAGQDFGWNPFAITVNEEWLTQDNGTIIELIRDPTIDAGSRFKGEKAPVVGLAHLDSLSCMRTGNPETPIIYFDRESNSHKLPWYNVIARSEFPSAIESMNGIGYCAVTRILRMAQILYSMEVFKDEKISGRQFGQIHIISGPSRTELDDALEKEMEKADNMGNIRWIKPGIVVSLDPEATISKETIEFASLPDGFDFDAEMKWYISSLALCLGVDYQDLAPLPGGNIGSSQQSEILHRKSRGKGPANWMESFQSWMHDYGVMPRNATFRFKIKDTAEQLEEVQVHKEMAELLSIARRSNILDGSSAREQAKKWGLFDEEVLNMVPDDFGNEEMSTRQMLGTAGGSTTGEDAQRVEKGLKKIIGGK